jgi:hypothetical protein
VREVSTASEQEWLAARRFLKAHRAELAAQAGALYREVPRVAGTGLLCRDGWLPPEPVELDLVRLDWADQAVAPAVTGSSPPAAAVRPVRPSGEQYRTYADALVALDRPVLFENRPNYRPLAVDLRATDGGRLEFSGGHYFESISVAEAVAHEYAAFRLAGGQPARLPELPLRAAIGDPCDLSRRPAGLAITTLTLRRSGPGEASFLLHWRDPAKVAHAGGLYQVLPVGVFQPADENPASVARDLSLWQGMAREFSEELLGAAEDYREFGSPIDYQRWEFFRRLSQARETGALRVSILGFGVDPLSLATDILTVAVFDAAVFDQVFGRLAGVNSEGRLISDDGMTGFRFTESAVGRFSGGGEPMQAAGAAVLRLAWRNREALLS